MVDVYVNDIWVIAYLLTYLLIYSPNRHPLNVPFKSGPK